MRGGGRLVPLFILHQEMTQVNLIQVPLRLANPHMCNVFEDLYNFHINKITDKGKKIRIMEMNCIDMICLCLINKNDVIFIGKTN